MQPGASAAAKDARGGARRRGARLGVKGITGSLSAQEVNAAMEKRVASLLKCVQRRPRRLGYVAGQMEFHFSVDAGGVITRTHVVQSTVGNARLEACLTQAAGAARLPRPAGNTATDARWDVSVDPMGPSIADLEEEYAGDLRGMVRANAEALYEACHVPKRERFRVVAYFARKGRVLSAGVQPVWRGRRRTKRDAEQLLCLSDGIQRWQGPEALTGRRKAAFELRWSKAPPKKVATKKRRRGKKKRKRGKRRAKQRRAKRRR